jgi:predicted RNase H-like HicB family nuclease
MKRFYIFLFRNQVILQSKQTHINYIMERILNIHIEKLEEGYYLATSDSIQGLVVQGRTIAETLEIAKDVAKKLLEAHEERIPELIGFSDNFDYPLVIGV